MSAAATVRRAIGAVLIPVGALAVIFGHVAGMWMMVVGGLLAWCGLYLAFGKIKF